MHTEPRVILDQTVWALPVPVATAHLTAIAALARVRAGSHPVRLIMHRRTLDAVRAAVAKTAGQMTVSDDLIERYLRVRIETDMMYPDNVVHAATR